MTDFQTPIEPTTVLVDTSFCRKPLAEHGGMYRMVVRSSILLCLVMSSVLSQEERISSQDHPELEKLFELDQKIRSGFLDATPDQLTEMRKADSDRRSRVLELYNSGMLKTENDYYRAAMIFQHGVEPDDYLFAHELAVASLALGNQNARWLAAAH